MQVTELLSGDRVILHCPQFSHRGRTNLPARFDRFVDKGGKRLALFQITSELTGVFFIHPNGDLRDDEHRLVTIQCAWWEAHG